MARKVKVCVIGSGSTGLFSLGQVRKGTKDFVVLDGGILGTTCARVGCMPSKAIIQAAQKMCIIAICSLCRALRAARAFARI